MNNPNAQREHTVTPVGRFAPTPGGELHAGNIICAMLAYLSAKAAGGKFIVRIEDLDPLRCPRDSAMKMLDTLALFGLVSDCPPVWQSNQTEVYRQKVNELSKLIKLYPCYCSRAELHAAHAPRLNDGGVVYAGTCKNLADSELYELSKKRKPCLRAEVPDEVIRFTDGVAGEYSQNLKTDCGDFILRRSDGVYAYQLAVSVDDGESGVTEVVRGRDLLSSTPRQIWLMRLLNYRVPKYYHISLVCDGNGRKLSKSEGDSVLRLLNKYPPEYILGKLAFAAGISATDTPATLDMLIKEFSWRKVKRGRIFLPL